MSCLTSDNACKPKELQHEIFIADQQNGLSGQVSHKLIVRRKRLCLVAMLLCQSFQTNNFHLGLICELKRMRKNRISFGVFMLQIVLLFLDQKVVPRWTWIEAILRILQKKISMQFHTLNNTSTEELKEFVDALNMPSFVMGEDEMRHLELGGFHNGNGILENRNLSLSPFCC